MTRVLSVALLLITGLPSIGRTQVDFPAIQQKAQQTVSGVPRDQAGATAQLQGSQTQVPGFSPQDLNAQQDLGNFYQANPGALSSQGNLNLTPSGQFLQQSYNTRPQVTLTPQDLLLQNSQNAFTQSCTTQTVCAKWQTTTESQTQNVTCHITYWEKPASCSYPLPPPQPVMVLPTQAGDWRWRSGYVSGWEAPSFDDSAWPVGAAGFGYGWPAERTALPGFGVYTMRRHLDTSSYLSCTNFQARFAVDDLITFYVNGTQAGKIPNPGGPASYFNGGTLSLADTLFRKGDNLIAYICQDVYGVAQGCDLEITADCIPQASPSTISAACGSYPAQGCAYLQESCTATSCTRDYLCLDPSKTTDGCAPYAAQGCALQTSQCALTNAHGQCLDQRKDFACTTSILNSSCAQEVTQVSCPNRPSVMCLNPADCFDTSSPKDPNMPLAVSNMQGLKAIQETKTINPVLVFGGSAGSCRNPITGANCCTLDSNILFSCTSDEQLLAQHRSAGDCVEVGTYCSSQVSLGFTSVCITQKTSFCCFSSKLVRIIQQQGRPQVGIGWGTPQNPDCRGLTPEELQRIDFSKIDFSEYYADITAKPVDINALTNQVQASPLLQPSAQQVSTPEGIDPLRFQQDVGSTFTSHAP
jgi:hypothetical protein